MLFDASDKLFEEAATSDDRCDKLIARIKRLRYAALISFAIGFLLLLVFIAWFVLESVSMLRSPSLTEPPFLHWFLSLRASTNYVILIPLVSFLLALSFCSI